MLGKDRSIKWGCDTMLNSASVTWVMNIMNEQVRAPKVACERNDKGENKTRETLTASWTLKHGKNIHGGRFCNSLAEHPEDLLVAELSAEATRCAGRTAA